MALGAISPQTNRISVLPPADQSEAIAGTKTSVMTEQAIKDSVERLQGATNSRSSAVTKILEAQGLGNHINIEV